MLASAVRADVAVQCWDREFDSAVCPHSRYLAESDIKTYLRAHKLCLFDPRTSVNRADEPCPLIIAHCRTRRDMPDYSKADRFVGAS